MKHVTKPLTKWLSVIIIAVLILGAALVLVPQKLGPELSRFSSNQNDLIENRGSSILRAKSGESTEFVIESGQSLGATARELAERDLVVNRLLFVFYSILTGHERDFKAGHYVLPERASIRDLVNIFSKGLSEPEDIEVTIPEGTNVADIDRIFAQSGLIRADDIIRMMLGLGQISHEGKLFPDTYRFKPPKPDEKLLADEIVKKLRDNFVVKTRYVFAGRFTGQGGADRGYETMVIASILEKEVKTEEDMRLVAGIISKRLELGIPLQIDATVAYGVCFQKFLQGKYCDVSQANIVDNLKVDSEYNTYVRKGLPIGPISNPGLKAIRAAFNPQLSDYLYYLSARDGTTIFSKTAAEHVRNRAKYLR